MRSLVLLSVLTLAACQNTPTEVADDPLPEAAAEATVPVTPTAAEIEAEANMSTETVADDMPAAPEVVARGSFSGASGHDVAGEAVWYRLDDGTDLIRLEGLESDNGPDLKLWLVRQTSGDVGAGGVSLGPLKSTRGDQNYPVPAGVDPSEFAGVSVWCERFSVNFGTAPLDDA